MTQSAYRYALAAAAVAALAIAPVVAQQYRDGEEPRFETSRDARQYDRGPSNIDPRYADDYSASYRDDRRSAYDMRARQRDYDYGYRDERRSPYDRDLRSRRDYDYYNRDGRSYYERDDRYRDQAYRGRRDDYSPYEEAYDRRPAYDPRDRGYGYGRAEPWYGPDAYERGNWVPRYEPRYIVREEEPVYSDRALAYGDSRPEPLLLAQAAAPAGQTRRPGAPGRGPVTGEEVPASNTPNAETTPARSSPGDAAGAAPASGAGILPQDRRPAPKPEALPQPTPEPEQEATRPESPASSAAQSDKSGSTVNQPESRPAAANEDVRPSSARREEATPSQSQPASAATKEPESEDSPTQTASAPEPDSANKASDFELITEVENRLARSGSLSGCNIRVWVDEQVVRLSGVVKSDAARRRAAFLARQVPDIVKVENHLRVPEADSKESGNARTARENAAMDSALARRVARQLTTEVFPNAEARAASLYGWQVEGENVSVRVNADDGDITLDGNVENLTDSSEAVRAARQIEGVRSVANNLRSSS